MKENSISHCFFKLFDTVFISPFEVTLGRIGPASNVKSNLSSVLSTNKTGTKSDDVKSEMTWSPLYFWRVFLFSTNYCNFSHVYAYHKKKISLFWWEMRKFIFSLVATPLIKILLSVITQWNKFLSHIKLNRYPLCSHC